MVGGSSVSLPELYPKSEYTEGLVANPHVSTLAASKAGFSTSI